MGHRRRLAFSEYLPVNLSFYFRRREVGGRTAGETRGDRGAACNSLRAMGLGYQRSGKNIKVNWRG